jgi:hypothetical protein
MKFTLCRASTWREKGEVEINTIEDLQKLDEEYGKQSLIIDFDSRDIIIYDDYVE